jgi:hypothetical protein
MLSLHSKSLAALTLSGGILAVLTFPNSTHAGDKIDFSSPSGSLDVPRVEVEKPDDSKSESHSGVPLNRMVSGENAMPMEVIIVRPAKRHDDPWGSTDENDRDRDQMNDADDNSGYGDHYDSLDARRSANAQREPSPDDSFTRFAEKRSNMDSSDPNSLRGRLEAMEAAEKADRDGSDRYGASDSDLASDSPWVRRDNSNGDTLKDQNAMQKLSAWSHDLLHKPDGTAIDRIQEKTAYNAMRGLDAQVDSTPRAMGALNEIQQNVTPVPTPDSFAADNNDLQRKAEDDAAGQTLTLHDEESIAATMSAERTARAQVPASQRWAVEERPAMLPFPKKPGDVLR